MTLRICAATTHQHLFEEINGAIQLIFMGKFDRTSVLFPEVARILRSRELPDENDKCFAQTSGFSLGQGAGRSRSKLPYRIVLSC